MTERDEELLVAFSRRVSEMSDFDERVLERFADIRNYGYDLTDAIADVIRGQDL